MRRRLTAGRWLLPLASRPVSLAQRRAVVRRKIALADGSARLGREHPAVSRRDVTRAQLQRLRVVSGHQLAAGSGGRLPGARLRAAGPKAVPAGGSSAAEASPAAMLASGPQGPLNWDYEADGEPLLSGYPANGSSNYGNDGVFPGEKITATVAMYNSSAADQQVHVTWEVICGGTDTNSDLGQVVTAPPSSESGSVQGGLASFTFQVPAPGSSTCTSGGPGVQALWFFAWGTVVGSSSSVGEGFTDDDLAVPAAQLAGCPGSPDSAGELNPQDVCGDPVDTASGDFSDTFTDATLRSPGYPLAMTRSYSSAVTAAGPMGPGWSLPWQARLSVQAGGDVILTAENGDQFDYTSNGDGTFTAPPGPRSLLAAVMSGSAITGYTLTAPDNHVLTFSASGQLRSTDDSTGRGITLGYTGSQVTSLTDAAGQKVTLAYTSGLLTRATLPDSQFIGYAYTGGRLTSVTTPGGASGEKTTYAYNSAGLLASIENPDGNFTARNTYNSAGQVTSQEDGTGAVTGFSYTTTSGGLPETDVTHPGGGISTDVYGGGTLLESVDPLGGTTSYEYNNFLQRAEVTDPLGNVTTTTYDSSGNLSAQIDPLGTPEEWAYNSNNTLAIFNNADLATTTYIYNSMDEPLTVTAPGGGKTTYVYNSAGNLTSSVSPRGNVSGANAANFTTTYAYNTSGQLASVTTPGGAATATTYDSMGFPLKVTDPLREVTTYAYNSAEEVASVTAPDGGITRYAYDLAGNLITRTDPDNNAWTYAYDADNRLSKVTDPLGNKVSYGYDGNGSQVSHTDARNIVTTTSYDANNDPIKITYSDGTPAVTYGYDADGNATSISDATGKRTLSYDADGALTSVAGPGSGSFAYAYAPDEVNLTSRTYPDGTTLTYGYNSADQVKSMTSGSAQTTYAYDAAGNLTSTVLPDGVTESRTYNDAGQLTGTADSRGTATLDSYALTLNADGQPAEAATTQHSAAQAPWYYAYDAAGRLASACQTSAAPSTCTTAAGGTETAWTYDKAGNMLTKVSAGTSASNTYNAGEQLTKATTGSSATSYGYNADGELTTAGASTYAYNGAGELSQAVTAAGTYTYTYDATGNLAADSKNGTLQQTTTWDTNNPLPQPAEQASAAGATTADMIYNPNATLNAMTTPAGTYNAATDWLGSVTGLVNSAGTQVSSTTYTPYGTPTTTGTPASPVGYAGSYTLPGSGGLDDMHARDYNPTTSALTSTDPLLAITGQPYAYASDDPVARTDPAGLIGVGGCLSGLAIFGIELFTSGCGVATLNLASGAFQLGYTRTVGVGTGIPSVGYLVGPEITNANSIAELGGPFAQIGGSGELATASVGGDFAIGQDPCGQSIWTAFGGVGQSVDLPWVAAGFEVHGGVTDTLTKTALSFNLYNLWDRLTSVFP